MMALRLARPSALVDINRIPELGRIEVNGHIEIGSGVRQRDAERHAALAHHAPLITEALTYVGHPRSATGDGLRQPGPRRPGCGDAAAMCALDAELVLARVGSVRTVSAHDFFTGYFTTVVEADEVLTAVRIPLETGPAGSCYQEFSRRHGDFALVGVGVLVRTGDNGAAVTEARVALSGPARSRSGPVTPRPSFGWAVRRAVAGGRAEAARRSTADRPAGIRGAAPAADRRPGRVGARRGSPPGREAVVTDVDFELVVNGRRRRVRPNPARPR